MVEIRRGSESGAGSDRLPWLEPVEDEDDGGYDGGPEDQGGGYGGVILASLGVLIAIALITTGIVWFRHHRAANADIGEIIHPEPGPYKVKPANPGGLDTGDTGTVAAGTSAGEDIDSVLDLNAVPERPMVTRQPAAQAAQPSAPQPAAQTPTAQPKAPQQVEARPVTPTPAPKPQRVIVAPAPVEAAPSDAGGAGGTVQLGAFSTEAKAKAAWKTLSSRFAMLKEMTPVIGSVDANGTKLFRLRAAGGTLPANRVCAQMRVAGDTCSVVGQ